jgi:hypothetical protein
LRRQKQTGTIDHRHGVGADADHDPCTARRPLKGFVIGRTKNIRALSLAFAMLLATPAVAQTVRDVPLSTHGFAVSDGDTVKFGSSACSGSMRRRSSSLVTTANGFRGHWRRKR